MKLQINKKQNKYNNEKMLDFIELLFSLCIVVVVLSLVGLWRRTCAYFMMVCKVVQNCEKNMRFGWMCVTYCFHSVLWCCVVISWLVKKVGAQTLWWSVKLCEGVPRSETGWRCVTWHVIFTLYYGCCVVCSWFVKKVGTHALQWCVKLCECVQRCEIWVKICDVLFLLCIVVVVLSLVDSWRRSVHRLCDGG